MKFGTIEITPSVGGGFTAIVDGKFAEGLTPDEALGVVASALFGPYPIYVRTYEEWYRWREKWQLLKPVSGLLEDLRV